MTTATVPELRGFELLSQPAQERLRTRIQEAWGDTQQIANTIPAALDALDQTPISDDIDASREHQADRAFLLAQLTYIEQLEKARADESEGASR